MTDTNATTLTVHTITEEQIETLETEASQAGDLLMVYLCQNALWHLRDKRRGMACGQSLALESCVDAINAARGMED